MTERLSYTTLLQYRNKFIIYLSLLMSRLLLMFLAKFYLDNIS